MRTHADGLTHGSYHRVLCLYGFDLQTVLHASEGSVGLQPVLRVSAALLGAGLVLPVLLWPLGPGGPVVPLLLGDVRFRAVDGLDVFPERAGVRVALGAAGDLAHVRFLRR